MQEFTQEGRNAVADIARRYGLSQEAVEHMLLAVNNGAGSMAQFNCPELGGSGQWMRGGMTMVGDMFNHNLKATVDRLCTELSQLLATTQVFPVRSDSAGSANGQWWPEGLGRPISSGSQNNTRYAVFDGRLAVDRGGDVTVYDTLDHRIGGVSQQQGGDNSLTFSSQYGTLTVASLPVISGKSFQESASSNFAPPAQQDTRVEAEQTFSEAPVSTRDESGDSVPPADDSGASNAAPSKAKESTEKLLALLENLAQLHSAGVLTEEEFSAKKAEVLARL